MPQIIPLKLKRRLSASVWRKDGQLTASPQNNEAEIMKDNLRLRRELAEKEKEILFLKKAAAFFAKEID